MDSQSACVLEMVGQLMMSEGTMARIVADHALCPQHESVRVMELTYLSEEPFGGRDNVRINPFLTGQEPLWPLDKARANHLAMYRCLLFLGVQSTNIFYCLFLLWWSVVYYGGHVVFCSGHVFYYSGHYGQWGKTLHFIP